MELYPEVFPKRPATPDRQRAWHFGATSMAAKTLEAPTAKSCQISCRDTCASSSSSMDSERAIAYAQHGLVQSLILPSINCEPVGTTAPGLGLAVTRI